MHGAELGRGLRAEELEVPRLERSGPPSVVSPVVGTPKHGAASAESPASAGSWSFGGPRSPCVRTQHKTAKRSRVRRMGDRLMITGEPHDLVRVIKDAQALMRQRESAKQRADSALRGVMASVTGEDEASERLRALAEQFLGAGRMELSKQHSVMEALVEQLLELRPQLTRQCTLFLFAIVPYTRQVLAADAVHEALAGHSDAEARAFMSSSYDSMLSGCGRDEHLFDAASDASGASRSAERDGFERELSGFQERLRCLHERIEAKRGELRQRNRPSPSAPRPRLSPRLSPRLASLTEGKGSRPRRGSSLRKSLKVSALEQKSPPQHPQRVRCRICEEMVDMESAPQHFEACLDEYKDIYSECRVDNLAGALRTMRDSCAPEDVWRLDRIGEGLDMILQARAEAQRAAQADAFPLEPSVDCAERMQAAQAVFLEVVESLEKHHRHAAIKALAVEALDLAYVEDYSREFASFSSPGSHGSVAGVRRPSLGSAATPVHNRRGPSVDDFDFLKTISTGSVGKVFLAMKRRTGDIFAVKAMNKADVVRKNLVARIVAERNVLARANCPFVVKFFFSFETSQQLFLAMEFVQGGDILALLNTYGVFPEAVALRYASEVVVALKYLHERLDVCHRDLKPDNILLDRHGHIKLTDFGLSHIGIIQGLEAPEHPHGAVLDSCRAAEESPATNSEHEGKSPSYKEKGTGAAKQQPSERTRRKMMRSQVGTPDYMAPEILLGTGHDFACDWWSLGIIIYEMLFGLPPFSDESPQRIFNNILSGRLPPAEEAHAQVSPEAWDLITSLLKPAKAERLGANGAAEVQAHAAFAGVDWAVLESGDLASGPSSPFVPSLSSDLDTKYFRSVLGHQDDRKSAFESGGSGEGRLLSEEDVVRLEAEMKAPEAVEFPNIDFSYSQLSNLQELNLAAAARLPGSKSG